MKLFGFGEREFGKPSVVNYVLSWFREVTGGPDLFVSGGAKGADTLCEEWMRGAGVECQIFEPDWGKHGRSAGAKRTRELIETLNPEEDFAVGFSAWTDPPENWRAIDKIGAGTKITLDMLDRYGIRTCMVFLTTAWPGCVIRDLDSLTSPSSGLGELASSLKFGDRERRTIEPMNSSPEYRPMSEQAAGSANSKLLKCWTCGAAKTFIEGVFQCPECKPRAYTGKV